MKLWFGVVALVLNVVGYGPYIWDTYRGRVRPQRVSWAIWAILMSIAAVNQIQNGGGFSSISLVSMAALSIVTFLMSIKWGMGGASTLDKICLALSIALFVYWAALHNTRVTTLIVVLIDGVATVPTLVKTYHHPETENYVTWIGDSLAGLFSLLAVTRTDWALLIYPAYLFVANMAVAVVKFIREKQPTKPAVKAA